MPKEKAKITGSAKSNPKRFKGRTEPKGLKPLGNPSKQLDGDACAVWEAFKKEMPWLMESDRAHMENTCILRARLLTGKEFGVQASNSLRAAIDQMGGNPSARSKVSVPDGEEENPADKYFN